MWNGEVYCGTKMALFRGNAIVACRREDKEGLPNAGKWDLPGGERDGDEDPIACALREVCEELGLQLTPDRVSYLELHPSERPNHLPDFFCVAELSDAEVLSIRFGDEGQGWALMPVEGFLTHPQAVTELKDRLRAYVEMNESAD